MAATCTRAECFAPELRISTLYREWNFGPDIIRTPEFFAPALGNRGNLVTIETEIPGNASGVLCPLGSSSGGLTGYLDATDPGRGRDGGGTRLLPRSGCSSTSELT